MYPGDSTYNYIGKTPIDSFVVPNNYQYHYLKFVYDRTEFIKRSRNNHNYRFPENTIKIPEGHRAFLGVKPRRMWLQGLDFENINIDLIAGMLDETDENWTECVHKVKELSPDCVTIYQMEIPYNTTIYKEMKESGKITAPVADWPTKRRWVSEAFDLFVEAGYAITSAYTVVKDPNVKFVYRDALWGGADMLGTGVASFGHIGGVHVQNEHDIGTVSYTHLTLPTTPYV